MGALDLFLAPASSMTHMLNMPVKSYNGILGVGWSFSLFKARMQCFKRQTSHFQMTRKFFLGTFTPSEPVFIPYIEWTTSLTHHSILGLQYLTAISANCSCAHRCMFLPRSALAFIAQSSPALASSLSHAPEVQASGTTKRSVFEGS